ncbi:hypothetical protein Vretimale_2922 [Volvox reticuliferus]|uniref:Uncharacterized protein n=1 Tax=Volvox reticuliferus TaxID=1737510 RepID=A0A8J4G373_9CHLO|nr:hypothetical protein Vretifemale_6903 [Volvox reticuliferus]GIL97179.1 hypothetical protein Vretimale_2922 [Volvox reticuliferus]
MTSSSESSYSDKDFERFLEVALQEIPPNIAEQLNAGLKKRYDNPPVEEMARCLNRILPLSEARQLLFNPTEEDMQLYPALIDMPPAGSPDNHAQQKIQVCAMAAIYLVHSKSWKLMRPFIEAGGLRQLAAALAHPNAYLASQAMSSLMHITDETLLFPWHEPPLAPDGGGPRLGTYALVFQRMFELTDVLLPNLLAHYRHPPAFPGSTNMALRLFAFYVSWLRKHYTRDGQLSLSASLLALLQKWGADEQVSEEERELAKQLYMDFSRCPPAEKLPAPNGNVTPKARSDSLHLLGGLSTDEEPETSVVLERTDINRGPSADNEAEQLKEQGNDAYRRGDYSTAIHLYSAALDVLVPTERLLTEGPRRAVYHSNRAAAYMARAASGRLQEGDADTTGHLEGVDHGSQGAISRHYEAAVMDCDHALALQPSGNPASKTLLRKCRALLQLGRLDEATAAARSGLDKCEGEGELRCDLQQVLRTAQQQQSKQHEGVKSQPREQAEAMASLSKAKVGPSEMKPESISKAGASVVRAKVASKPVVGASAQELVIAQADALIREMEASASRSHASNGGGTPTDWNAMD